MGRHSAFSAEMEKIAKVRLPTALLLGGVGAGVGAYQGGKGAITDQRLDDARLRKGFISRQDWQRRKEMRLAQTGGGALAGAALGSMSPALGRRFKKWVSEVSDPLAEAIGKNLRESADYVEKRYSRSLMEQVDYAATKTPEVARASGEAFAEGAAASTGRSPIQVRVGGLFGG